MARRSSRHSPCVSSSTRIVYLREHVQNKPRGMPRERKNALHTRERGSAGVGHSHTVSQTCSLTQPLTFPRKSFRPRGAQYLHKRQPEQSTQSAQPLSPQTPTSYDPHLTRPHHNTTPIDHPKKDWPIQTTNNNVTRMCSERNCALQSCRVAELQSCTCGCRFMT
jgi:hypothetical protein